MSRPFVITLARTVALSLVAGALAAQQPRPVSVDMSLGGGQGLGGGELAERGGVALDALLSLQPRAAGSRNGVFGVAVGIQTAVGFGDKCRLASTGQCLDEFPTLSTVGLLAGSEFRLRARTPSGPTLRLLAGPAYVHLDGHTSLRRYSAAGIEARGDLASSQLGPVAALLSLRSLLIPRARQQTLGAWALGVGLRLR